MGGTNGNGTPPAPWPSEPPMSDSNYDFAHAVEQANKAVELFVHPTGWQLRAGYIPEESALASPDRAPEVTAAVQAMLRAIGLPPDTLVVIHGAAVAQGSA
jgi:hypothetical protein